MEIMNLDVDQNLTIIDRDLWNETNKIADLNEREIEARAEERFKKYVANDGIELSFTVKSGMTKLGKVKFDVYENNYDSYGWDDPIDVKLARSISEQISSEINKIYDDPVTIANNYIISNEEKVRMDKIKSGIRGFMIGMATCAGITIASVCLWAWMSKVIV